MPVTEADLLFTKKVKGEFKNEPKFILMPASIPLMSVEDLIPYENNVKIHTHQQVAKICQSIDKSGRWTNPIIVDGNNVIIAGHGRRLAAIRFGFLEVPVLKLDGISEKDASLLRIADNKVAEGEVDTSMLEEEIRILSDFGVDMVGIFDERELNFLVEDLGEIDFGQISDDISDDVSRQFEENEKLAEEIEDKTLRLSDIFGRRPLSGVEGRILSNFLAYAEEQQGDEGIDALVGFAENFLETQE